MIPLRTLIKLKRAKGRHFRQLGQWAFTNLNKVRGRESSGKEYWTLANADISGQLLRAELDILQPKIVVCCGTSVVFHAHVKSFSGVVINMPHPAARIGAAQMLHKLAGQADEWCAPL